MEHTKAAEEQRVTQVLLRSHVERCLQDIWDVPDLVIDDDGDYPYRRGTAMCWVSPFDGPVPGVRVFAHAAYGLKPSAKLLREVNDLNVRSTWARVAFQNGVVRVSAELHWAAVDRLALEQAARLASGRGTWPLPSLREITSSRPYFLNVSVQSAASASSASFAVPSPRPR